MKLEIVGIALAGLLTHGITLILMTLFTYKDPEMKDTLIMPDKRTFEDLKSYLAIGLPNVIMLCLDLWAYDLMTIMSGYLGVESQAA